MSMVLYIQTALEKAMVGISENGHARAYRENDKQKEHAAFLQPAIRDVCSEAGVVLKDLTAISVVSGPGSYTGLRVGMAGAKGLCFALKKPLITVNTLRWMAAAGENQDTRYLCPMIDARRMEVFTALFDPSGETILEPFAAILDENLFKTPLDEGKIVFFGGGAAKFRPLLHHPNAVFSDLGAGQAELARLSWKLYQAGVFSDLAQTAPLYGKDFHSPAPQL